jgi:hypothetical protein
MKREEIGGGRIAPRHVLSPVIRVAGALHSVRSISSTVWVQLHPIEGRPRSAATTPHAYAIDTDYTPTIQTSSDTPLPRRGKYPSCCLVTSPCPPLPPVPPRPPPEPFPRPTIP